MEQLEDRSLLATLSIGPGGLHVAEGGTATLQVSLSQPQMQPTMFTFRTVSGSAIGGADYQEVLSGNGTIMPMSTFASVSIQALTDSITDLAETFSVELLTASGATINPAASSAVVTIDNVEPPGGGSGGGSATLSLSAPADVDEGEGFSLTAQLSSPGTYQINATINWGATPGAGPTNFSGMTNADGSFTIGHQYFDDGPAGGNGTPQDVETITLTGTATKYTMQGPIYIPLSGTVSTTIYNVAPANVIDIYNSTPLGGPRWMVSGAYQDVGLADRGTLQIDWGDQSPLYLETGLLVGDTFSQAHTYPADGLSYTITVTLTDDDMGVVSKSKSFGMYLFDLDNDANNDGAIASSDEDLEPSSTPGDEMPTGGLPGRYIAVNDNDDNANDIPDMDENGPIYGENDLEPFEVKWQEALRPEITNYDAWKVTLTVWQISASSNQSPQIWSTPDKSGSPLVKVPGPTSAEGYVSTWIVGLQNPTAPGVRNADELPQTLYLEARSVGQILMKLRLWTPGGTPVASDAVLFMAVPPPAVDVDGDSNNDGAIDEADDSIELDDPGYFVPLNRDDDNWNFNADKNDAPFVDILGAPMDDDDLRLVRFSLGADATTIPGYQVLFSNGNKIKLWKTMDKQPLPMQYTIGTNILPTEFYVEGLFSGQDHITASLKKGSGAFVTSDTITVFVGFVDLTAYRPQTETAGYGNPFPRTPVYDQYEDSPGVGIRVNGDDDDADGTFDFHDTDGVAGENDLIEVTIEAAPLNLAGVKWFLKRGTTDISVFLNADRTNPLWGENSPDTEVDVTLEMFLGFTTLWVEWTNVAGTATTSTLTMQMRDARILAAQHTVAEDSITFNAFQSIVIALGGRDNAPLNQLDGAFVIAGQLYSGITNLNAGFDVHAYDEDDVFLAFAEVKEAVKRRNVNDIAIIGYSQGGGAAYWLSELLDADIATDDVTLGFTAYIDGIKPWNIQAGAAENRRPIRSDYHVNYRQASGKFYGGILLEGVDTPQGPSVNTNVTVTPWGTAHDHLTIDADPRVVGRIINGFTGPATATEPVHEGIIDRLLP